MGPEDPAEEDEKDLIIKRQKEEIDDLKLEVLALKKDLFREKDINEVLLEERRLRVENNKLLNERRSAASPSSPLSPSITLAHRSHSLASLCGQSPTLVTAGRSQSVTSLSQLITPCQHHSSTSPAKSVRNPEGSQNPESNSQTESPSHTHPSNRESVHVLAPLHPRETGPSNKLGYILNALQNVPNHRSTVMIGDSNFHCVNVGEIDPTNRSVAIRSVSGLCVVSASDALKKFTYSYPKFKKVVLSVGANDFMHRDQHCPDDWSTHLSNLITDTHRIFPQAVIHFVLPFRGLDTVPPSFIEKFEYILKTEHPQIKKHYAPSMAGKTRRDGIHLNAQGAEVLRTFLSNTFTKHRRSHDQQEGGDCIRYMPSSTYNSYRDAVNGNYAAGQAGPPLVENPTRTIHTSPIDVHSSLPYFNPQCPPPPDPQYGNQRDIVRKISDALVSLLSSHMQLGSGG